MRSKNSRYKYKKQCTGLLLRDLAASTCGLFSESHLEGCCCEGQCSLHKFKDSSRHKDKCYSTEDQLLLYILQISILVQ